MIIETAVYLLKMKMYTVQDAIENIGEPNGKYCNICGWYGKYFKSFYNKRTRMKESTICPRCGSVDRTRFTFAYLMSKRDRYYDILDVGVGEVKAIKKALPRANCKSIDIKKGIADYVMDVTDLKFDNCSFDIVLCLAVLQEIEEDLLAIREMYRVLKKNGEMLIYVPLGYYKDPHGTKPTDYNISRYYDTSGSARIYEKEDFTGKLKEAGFKVDCLQFATHGGYKHDNVLFRGIR